jgi:hypothetical protein
MQVISKMVVIHTSVVSCDSSLAEKSDEVQHCAVLCVTRYNLNSASLTKYYSMLLE